MMLAWSLVAIYAFTYEISELYNAWQRSKCFGAWVAVEYMHPLEVIREVMLAQDHEELGIYDYTTKVFREKSL